MFNMFNACVSLTSIDLSNFTTQNVSNLNLRSIFKWCESLKKENIIAKDNRIYQSFRESSGESDTCNII